MRDGAAHVQISSDEPIFTTEILRWCYVNPAETAQLCCIWLILYASPLIFAKGGVQDHSKSEMGFKFMNTEVFYQLWKKNEYYYLLAVCTDSFILKFL